MPKFNFRAADQRKKYFFAGVLILSTSVLSIGCGGSTGGSADEDGGISLAEAAADLPRPDGRPAAVSAPDVTPSSPSAAGTNFFMRRFLWKPVSESDGNLVVLVDPQNVDVLVSGSTSETLRDTGPSNGRGTTARASRPGCEFGENVRVQFFQNGQPIGFIDGTSTVTIQNGCEREEFDL